MTHIPRKRFGQHFLHDPGILRKIVQAIAPQPGDDVVEIGPGEGALTLPLLRELGRMTVIELDRDLVPRLRAAAEGIGELEIVNADVLTVDFSALRRKGPLRVVGNLPYNISSPILFHCLDHIDAIRDMHFMLQKEVVERMAAAPGSKVYGRLSVMLQLVCRVEPLLRVPAGAFRPPPKVESAVVRLTPRPVAERPIADAGLLADIVRAALRPTPQDVVECVVGHRRRRRDRARRRRSARARGTTFAVGVHRAGARRAGAPANRGLRRHCAHIRGRCCDARATGN